MRSVPGLRSATRISPTSAASTARSLAVCGSRLPRLSHAPRDWWGHSVGRSEEGGIGCETPSALRAEPFCKAHNITFDQLAVPIVTKCPSAAMPCCT